MNDAEFREERMKDYNRRRKAALAEIKKLRSKNADALPLAEVAALLPGIPHIPEKKGGKK